MKLLKRLFTCRSTDVHEFIDIIQLERFTCLGPTSRFLSLKHNTGSLRCRLYSSCNHPCWISKIPSVAPEKYFRNCSTSSNSKKTSLVENESNEETAVSTTVQKIKQTSETVFWSGIILCGLTFAIGVIYVITTELFSDKSPHRVYSKAFSYVSKDERVLNELGDQLKAYGEETRRGRRQHVSHIEYNKDGKNYLRMKFHIKGNRGAGTVHLEMIENDEGNYEYRYMFVVVEIGASRYRKTVILEDNRSKYDGGGKLGSSLEVDGLKELDLSMK